MNTEVFELSPLNPWTANAPFLWILAWFMIWFAAWLWSSRGSRSQIPLPNPDSNLQRSPQSSSTTGSGSKSRPATRVTNVVLLSLTFALAASAAHSYALLHARIEVDHQAIRFVAHSIYSVPRDKLILSKLTEVDLDKRPAFSPAVELDGFYVPGFRTGWYRLENGIRAYMLSTHRRNGIVIPTRDNYALFVSPKDPQAFINALKNN